MMPQQSINCTVLSTISLFFMFSLFPVIGYSTTLDTHGNYAQCHYECTLTNVTLSKKVTNRTNYKIAVQCAYKAYGEAACPPGPPETFIGEGWYDNKLKIAAEKIQFKSLYHINTVSKCTSDPWLGSWVDCTTIQRDVVVGNYHALPDYTPVTARLMSHDNKDRLNQEVDTAETFIQAPYVLEPGYNTEFESHMAIPIEVRHLKLFSVEFRIQRRDSPNQPFSDFSPGNLIKQQRPSNFDDLIITKTTFEPKKTGDFRIQARCSVGTPPAGWNATISAEWSDWRYFTIKPVTPPEISIHGQPFKLSDDVMIETEHVGKYSLDVSFRRTGLKQNGVVPLGNYVDVEPLSKDCSGANKDGLEMTSCSYKFEKTGKYRVIAKYGQGVNAPSNTKEFKITLGKVEDIKPSPTVGLAAPEIIKPVKGMNTKLGSPVDVQISYNPDFGPATLICYKGFGTDANEMYKQITVPSLPGTLHYRFYFFRNGNFSIEVKYKNHPTIKSTRSFKITGGKDPDVVQIISPQPSKKYTLSDAIPIKVKYMCYSLKGQLYYTPYPKVGKEGESPVWPPSKERVSIENYAYVISSIDELYSMLHWEETLKKIGRYSLEVKCKHSSSEYEIREFEITGPTPPPIILSPTPGESFKLSDGIYMEIESNNNAPIKYSFERAPLRKSGSGFQLPSTYHSVEPLSKNCSGAEKDDIAMSSCTYFFKNTGHYRLTAKYTNGENGPSSSRKFDIVQNSYPITPKPNLTSTLQEEQLSMQSPSLTRNNLSPVNTMLPIAFDRKKMRFISPKAVVLTLLNTGQQKLVFDFQYKGKNRLFQHVSKAPVVTLKHGNHKTTATLKKLQPGKWRVRAKHTTNKCRWSQWYTFSVVDPKKGITITKPPQILPPSSANNNLRLNQKAPEIISPKKNYITKTTARVSVAIRHYKKVNPSVNVRGLKTGNGRTAGSLSFKKAGEYRFRVKENQPGAKWSKWREFKIRSGIKINKPRRRLSISNTN